MAANWRPGAQEDIDAYRLRAREWLAKHAPDFVRPRGGIPVEERLEAGRRWTALKASAGYSGISIASEYGGAGGTELHRVVFGEEEMAYELPSVFFGVSLGTVVPTLALYGSEQAKRELIPPAVHGDEIWCQLFSEPSAGSDLAAVRMSGHREGDGWVLNGQKVWTSWAQFAEWGYIVVRTDPTLPKHAGLTCFYLNMKSPGVDVRPLRRIGGEQEINEVFFDNTYVPDGQRLGEVNGGFKVIISTLMVERFALSDAFIFGPTTRDFIRLAQDRKIGGRPAIEEGTVREAVARSYAEWLGQGSINARAMAALAHGQEPGAEGAIRKLVAALGRQRLSSQAMYLMGADALELDPKQTIRTDYTHSWIDVPYLRIAGGSDEILRNTIAEKILRLPQDYRPDKKVPYNQSV